MTPHGLKDATQLQVGAREYWARWPDAGIGLVTDGLVVLDFDVMHGGLESKGAIEAKYGPLPKTRTHKTGGGGLHLIYRNPNGSRIRNTVCFGGFPGVDLRADGGYIVIPPSLHQSGNRYELLDNAEIAPAPAWVVELAAQKKRAPRSEATVGDIIPEGQRDSTLSSQAPGPCGGAGCHKRQSKWPCWKSTSDNVSHHCLNQT